MPRIVSLIAVPIALAVGALGLAACGGGGGPSASKLPTGVVAQVQDSQITQAELDQAMAVQAAQAKTQGQTFPTAGTEQYTSLRQQVLQQIVFQRIIDFESAKCGARCKVTPSEIDKELTRIKKSAQFGGSQAKFDKFLKDRKLTLKDARQLLRNQLESPKLSAYVTRGVRFTEADARRYYQQNPTQFQVAASRDARHILVKNKALAQRIRGQINDGNFATLARKYSIDPGTKSQGGELGAIQRGTLVPEFERVAFALKDGQISKPFKTQFGWHIVQVHIKPARKQTFAQAKKQIISSQLQLRRTSVLNAWQTKVLASYEKHTTYASPDLAPAATTAAATAPVPTTAPAQTAPPTGTAATP
jgi:foldase protein PrsA